MPQKNGRKVLTVCLLFIATLFAATTPPRAEQKTEGDELFRGLESRIPELMDKAWIPGLSIAILQGGKPVWIRGFGLTSVQKRTPVTEGTVFEAASLSKPVFAYAVMQLVEKGVLKLDTPLVSYVPDSYIESEFLKTRIEDPRFRKITARMVLSHSPGFPNWRRGGPLTIGFEPGEKFSYSGEGFVYLQKVVEHMTGKPLQPLMGELVFGPLGMADSSYVWRADYETSTAIPYGALGDPAAKNHPKQANAAASLHTTARDYARFLSAILNRERLKEETAAEMFRPQSSLKNEPSGSLAWGLGFGLQRSSDGMSVWHWGDNGNFKAYFEASLSGKSGVVFFANSGYGLTVVQDVVDAAVGGAHPALDSSIMSEYQDRDYTGVRFARMLAGKGADGAIRDFLDAGSPPPPEGFVNMLGYQLLRMKKLQEAIRVFRWNVELYPASSNVYDSLGEAYAEAGETEAAIANYEKSLELNPGNEAGRRMLEKLRQKK